MKKKTFAIFLFCLTIGLFGIIKYPIIAQSQPDNQKPSQTICQDTDGVIVGYGANCICGSSICVPNPCPKKTKE